MKFTIIEFDKDYHTVTDYLYKEFNSLQEARKWCQENSRAGYEYYVENSGKYQ